MFQQAGDPGRQVLVHAGGQDGATDRDMVRQAGQLVFEEGQLLGHSQGHHRGRRGGSIGAPGHPDGRAPVGLQVVRQGQGRQRRIGPQLPGGGRDCQGAVFVIHHQQLLPARPQAVQFLQQQQVGAAPGLQGFIAAGGIALQAQGAKGRLAEGVSAHGRGARASTRYVQGQPLARLQVLARVQGVPADDVIHRHAVLVGNAIQGIAHPHLVIQ